MDILIGLLVVLVVVFLVYRRVNKTADDSFVDTPAVSSHDEPATVLEEALAPAVVNAVEAAPVEEKKPRKKKASTGGKKSAKKINSVEK